MLTGLAAHAPVVFMRPEIVGENLGYESPLVLLIASWIHIWRMPAFFLLSGFFAQLIMERRGIGYFLQDRIVRIFLTMVLFAVIIGTILQQPVGRLFHLWFLYYLFIVSCLAALSYGFVKIVARAVSLRPVKLHLSYKILFLVGYFFFIVYLNHFARENGGKAIIPSTYADFGIGSIIYYWSFFLLGQIAYHNARVFDIISTRGSLIICFLAAQIVGLTIFSLHKDPVASSTWVINTLSTATTLLWAVFLIGISHRFIVRKSRILDLLIEWSYPIFLCHIVPSILFGIYLYRNGFTDLEMMIPNIIFSGTVCVLVYYALIKFTPLNWIINGYRKSWFTSAKLKRLLGT